MNEKDEIEVSEKCQLLEMLSKQNIEVEWMVTSDVGPDWIGSTTEIDFYWGTLHLKNNGYLQRIIESLKVVAGIPESGGDRIINGEATISAIGESVHIKYYWSSCFPYMDADKKGNGEAQLNA